MRDERRRHVRRLRPLDCVWQGVPARMSDLSWGGCYVDTREVPHPGSGAEITVILEERPIVLRGTVVHADRGMGFALSFGALSDPARDFLRSALGELSGGPA